MAEVRVDLGQASYDIHIGAGMIEQLSELIGRQKFSRKALLITDEHVASLYGSKVLSILQQAGLQAEIAAVAAGEDSKSIETAMKLYTTAIVQGLDRKSPIIALGGGVVGDLTGFIAATYLRGVPFIQIPTTLLSQVDSSVGGKVAINHELGKNLIGAFYQPCFVLIDTDVLNTLPERELLAGLAEVIKYGVIADNEFFHFLDANKALIMAKDRAALSEVICSSCRIKADIVSQDEREADIRIILNFGHTIAHAIEGSTGFDRYNHGEAVAIGMHGAMLISHYLGLCPRDAVDTVKNLLLSYGLPVTAPGCRVADLFEFINRDKKAVGGKVHWVLVKAIGEVLVSDDVPESIVTQVLNELT